MGRGLSLSAAGRPFPRTPWASQVPPVARRPDGPALSGSGAGTGGTGGGSAPGSCPRHFTPAAFCPSTLIGTGFSDPTFFQPLAHPTWPCYLMSPFALVTIKREQRWMRSPGGCGGPTGGHHRSPGCAPDARPGAACTAPQLPLAAGGGPSAAPLGRALAASPRGPPEKSRELRVGVSQPGWKPNGLRPEPRGGE